LDIDQSKRKAYLINLVKTQRGKVKEMLSPAKIHQSPQRKIIPCQS